MGSAQLHAVKERESVSVLKPMGTDLSVTSEPLTPSLLLEISRRVLGTWADVAEYFDVHPTFISQLRSRKRGMPADMAFDMAYYLDLDPTEAYLLARLEVATNVELKNRIKAELREHIERRDSQLASAQKDWSSVLGDANLATPDIRLKLSKSKISRPSSKPDALSN